MMWNGHHASEMDEAVRATTRLVTPSRQHRVGDRIFPDSEAAPIAGRSWAGDYARTPRGGTSRSSRKYRRAQRHGRRIRFHR